MDFVGPLPMSGKGHDMIFTIVDRFSRLSCFIPMKSTCTALDVANMFMDNWVCKHGMPSKIISDRDTKFTS